ncbi:MAG TPA: cob(I)yrinic acid a,c-diamide adenosyltransferase [Micropepsaceae bacterium]|nr:cob(I)yrinic acid a,c-diamide adenosyltransferase [Micropepsaceae bacterium]
MKIDRIYTRGGDSGATSLGDGTRVAKHSLRVRAMGAVDEANAAIGVVIAHAGQNALAAILLRIQNDLFDLGADLCVPQSDDPKRPRLRIAADQVAALEREIDRVNAGLNALTSFILPGGSAASAHLHLARAITRRAECELAALAAAESINPELLKYLNRLSDLLFVLARQANNNGAADVLWQPGLNR